MELASGRTQDLAWPSGQVMVILWMPYAPSAGAWASFLSIGIEKDGELIGVFSAQLPPEARPKNYADFIKEHSVS